jgi:hypothetical protein
MEGGLGVRDLRKMNKALILKLVWQLAQGGDKLWVAVMRAKYCKEGSLWQAEMEPGVSPLWRAMWMLRGKIQTDLVWVIENSEEVNVIGQPWFEGWEITLGKASDRSGTRVAQCINRDTGEWDTQRLLQVGG